ncbi:MAG: cation:proton antiporter domain-containing protein, partial [Planctomycetota bacterium]
MYQNLAILCAFIFVYSVLSKGLERTPINGAVVFAAFGLAVGPFGLNLLKMDMTAEGLRTLAELTLAFVLFADASNADLGVLKKTFRIPQRLLVIGLPLTILLGFGAGVFLFDTLTLFEVAILATLLAPTDAALGKAVVTNESVPDNLRQALSVESGFNDGICVPVLFVFLALASGSNTEDSTSMLALKLVAEEIGIGLAVGAALTMIGVLLLKGTHRLGWITETWRQLPVAALAVGCFCLAQA